MKNLWYMAVFILLFQGCSFKSVENQWEYNSASAFNAYTKNFLEDKEFLAQDDLQRAISYAKQSADLEPLARIYLGTCALHLSVGIHDDCIQYKEIEELINSFELHSYFYLVQKKIEMQQIKNLPIQYRDFAYFYLQEDAKNAYKAITQMQQPSSKFISSYLMQERLTKQQINEIIDMASFYGYKKVIIFWLKYLYRIEQDMEEKRKIDKKIEILTSFNVK